MSNNVRVLARFRPASSTIGHRRENREAKSGRKGRGGGGSAKKERPAKMLFSEDSKACVVQGGGVKNKRFNFDYVHQPDSKQDSVFESVGADTVQDVLKGYNATIFAYGQTGSGKTYTMFGESKAKGVIPRCAEAIFDGIANSEAEVDEVFIKVAFVEIYQEKIRDLLNPTGQALRIREKPDGSTYIEGSAEEYCESPDDIYRLIREGNKHRAVGSTDMNNQSSRSHSVLMIHVTQKLSNGTQLEGGLNLADLAGSERLDRTNATGIGLKEAMKINQSLSALGNCINALTDRKRSHIPFRDSVLTWLLKDALGGNSKTVLVVCCSPDSNDAFETLSTLRFAERAKKVKNTAKVNTTLTVEQYQKLVKSLRARLEKKDKIISELQAALAGGGSLSPEQIEKLKGLWAGNGASQPVIETSMVTGDEQAGGLTMMDGEDIDDGGGGAVGDETRPGGAGPSSPVDPSLDQSDLMRQASDVLKSFQSLGLDAKSGAADTKGSPPQRDDFEEMQKRFLGGQGGTPVSTPAAAHVRGVSSFAFPDTAASPAGTVDLGEAESLLRSFQASLGGSIDSLAGVTDVAADATVAAPSGGDAKSEGESAWDGVAPKPTPSGDTQSDAADDKQSDNAASVDMKDPAVPADLGNTGQDETTAPANDIKDEKDETSEAPADATPDVADQTKADTVNTATGESEPKSTSAPEEPKKDLSPEEKSRALTKAAKSGDASTFQSLIGDAGLSSDASTDPSLVHAAAAGGCVAIIEVLLAARADPNAIGKKKRNPLMSAVSKNRYAAAECLVAARASLDHQDADGLTPLMHAARGGHQKITELLVEAKANVELRNNDGLTAAEIQRQRGAYLLSLLEHQKEDKEEGEYKEPTADETVIRDALGTTAQNATVATPSPELVQAVAAYEKAVDGGDTKALFSLAQCYAAGRGVKRNPQKAYEMYSDERLATDTRALLERGRCLLFGVGVPKDPEQAVKCFHKGADLNDTECSAELGWAYARGRGVGRDGQIAMQILASASAAGSASGTCGLGFCNQKGIGTAVDERKAIALFEKAAEAGDPAAFVHLGCIFLASKDPSRAFLLFQKASDMGNRAGKRRLAECYVGGKGVAKDSMRAVRLFQEAAVLGDEKSLLRLGQCYVKGEGVARNLDRGVQLYRRGVELENLGAMVALGKCYEREIGVRRSFKVAAKLYARASELGDPTGAMKLGECYEHARGVNKNTEKAFQLYTRAQESGLVEAVTKLAWCYASGVEVDKDGQKAFDYFSRASQRGSRDAIRGLGFCYEKGLGVSQPDIRKAVTLYQKAAEAGNATAWSDLANCVVNASGAGVNNKKAFLLFKKSASMGDPVGNRKLGWCYVKGIGVDKEVRKGVHYYHRAADMGDSMAISSLGVCYAKGMGVKKDTKKAFQLFQRAAEMGNPTDICNLGVCYKKGTGVAVDHKKAAELYQKAADMGDAAAICNLGVCYYNGTGVPKNVEKAMGFWSRAAEMGNSAARHNLERCRKAKAKRSDVLLVASLEKVAKSEPASIENDNLTVLEQPLFRTPMNKLTPEEQERRRTMLLGALRMTLSKIKDRQKRDERRASSAGTTASGGANPAQTTKQNLKQLVESLTFYLDLLREPRVRRPARIAKPVSIKPRRRQSNPGSSNKPAKSGGGGVFGWLKRQVSNGESEIEGQLQRPPAPSTLRATASAPGASRVSLPSAKEREATPFFAAAAGSQRDQAGESRAGPSADSDVPETRGAE